ncbi:MAG: hypothetical protein ACRDSR_06035 [Pseudonocardiaceae bacterium]
MEDAILYWNDVALEANKVSHSTPGGEQGGPTLSSRALAIAHLSMYDAYAGAVGNPANLPPYLGNLPASPTGAAPDAAIAGGAHTALSALYPSQKQFFDTRLTQAPIIGTASQRSDGLTFGATVARALLADRSGDPDAGSVGYLPSTAQDAHRVDPDNPGQGFHAPFYGAKAKCFAVGKRHTLDKPPMHGEPSYLASLRQVRGKGIAPELAGTLPASLTRRTVDETLMGIFWAYDGTSGIGTPPRFYNQILRAVALAKSNTLAENARLFGLANVAMADSGILAWEQKYHHNLWRPVLALREHDRSLGPEAVPDNDISNDTDLGWLPLGSPRTNGTDKNFTPPFPAYPSGHATFGAAAFHMTRLFYNVNDHRPDSLLDGMSFISDEFNGISRDNRGTIRPRHERNFPDGLWGMIKENSVSRIFLGVHWDFDGFVPGAGNSIDLSKNIGGVPLGVSIAEDVFNGGREKGMKKSTV